MSDQQHDHISAQVQQQLEQYRQVAQALRASNSPEGVEAALAPIISLPEEEQMVYLKTLSREEHTVEAADVALALNTISSNKAVRKEARRSLVRLEEAETFPEWEPPALPTLGQALELFSNPPQGVEEEMDDDISAAGALDLPPEASSFLSDLQSFFTNAAGLTPGPEYADTVAGFLEEWGDGDYENAYEYLASTSPLRSGLASDEWAARHRQWEAQAQPKGLRIAFITPLDNEDDEQGQPGMEVGWSLQYNETPQGDALQELPMATVAFKETGRHWFWARYTVVEEDDEWLIQDIIDEGARIFQLPTDEIQQRISEIREIAEQYLEEDELGEELEDEEELKDEELEDEEDEEDEDLDDEDEEDEDEEMAETLERVEQAIRITTQAMHYNDALLARATGADPEVYQVAFDQAIAMNDPERAAVYAQQIAEHFPEHRGQALRNLSIMYMEIGRTYLEDEESEEEPDEEQAQRFATLAENTLRDAITIDNAPQGYIMLANLLVAQDKDLDEAEELLNKARPLTTEQKDIISIEMGLAEVAQSRDEKEKALGHYQRVAELAPDDADVHFRIGFLQRELHRYKDALENLHRSIKLEPAMTEAYVELAVIYMEQDNLQKARQVLKDGLEITPDATDLLASLAIAYLRSGDLNSAERYLNQAEEIDDEDELVQAARQIFNTQRAQMRTSSRSKQQPRNNKKRKR